MKTSVSQRLYSRELIKLVVKLLRPKGGESIILKNDFTIYRKVVIDSLRPIIDFE